MAKIRRLTLFDIKELQKLVSLIDFDIPSSIFAEKNFTPFPVDILHDLLPVNKKFLQESYVAVEKAEILGLVSIIADGNENERFRINKLILNTNAYDAGKQLIDFVVNKYGGAGVETFIVSINDDHEEALTLFRDACLFRGCSQVQVWQSTDLKHNDKKFDATFFRKSKLTDAQKIHALYQESLFPHFRHSLSKNKNEFKTSKFTELLNKIRKYAPEKMVITNPQKNSIEGYFVVSTNDGINYWLDINLSLPYLEYYNDVIGYASEYVMKKNTEANLNVFVRKYCQGSAKLLEIVQESKFKCLNSQQVLVKDYWRPAKLKKDKKKAPIIIFPDMTSPAYFYKCP